MSLFYQFDPSSGALPLCGEGIQLFSDHPMAHGVRKKGTALTEFPEFQQQLTNDGSLSLARLSDDCTRVRLLEQ